MGVFPLALQQSRGAGLAKENSKFWHFVPIVSCKAVEFSVSTPNYSCHGLRTIHKNDSSDHSSGFQLRKYDCNTSTILALKLYMCMRVHACVRVCACVYTCMIAC